MRDSKSKPSNTKNEDLAIFVGGLGSTCTAQDLKTYFKTFGRIASCEPQTWKKGGKKCRGFALVYCGNKKTQIAILKHNRHTFQGRVIECKQYFSSKDKLESHKNNVKRRKVFVGGLPPEIQSLDLERYFMHNVGKVEIAYVVTQHKSGKSKGFGYVVFKSIKDRRKALGIKDFFIGKKLITVSEYSLKEVPISKKKRAKRAKEAQEVETTWVVKRKNKRVEGGRETLKVAKQGSDVSRSTDESREASNKGSKIVEGENKLTSEERNLVVMDMEKPRTHQQTPSESHIGEVYSSEQPTKVGTNSKINSKKDPVALFKRRRGYSLFGKFKNKILFRKFQISK